MSALSQNTGLDAISVEIIGSALASIVEEMGEKLVRASFSTNIKERRDCSTALLDPAGQVLCQAEHVPVHLGSFLGLIEKIHQYHAADSIEPGDIFLCNDPYRGGGTHLPDLVVAQPIFADGVILAWAVNTAHHADFVDRGHAHIFQEGIRIPPSRLFRKGVLQSDIQNIFLLNCQVPQERISDLHAQISALRLAEQRLQELTVRYGTSTLQQAFDALMDYAERRMRAAIAALPDGCYRVEDRFDNPELDGELPVALTLTISGDEMVLDFEAPPQVKAGFNMVRAALLATVYYAVKAVADPEILPNAGLGRPITVNAPEGSIFSCTSPAAVINRTSAAQRSADLVIAALAQAVPALAVGGSNGAVVVTSFSGEQDGGQLWVYLEAIGGGSGARATKDGLSGVHVHVTNTSNLPVEALEAEYPLLLDAYELVDGSGGEGQYRGGMGLLRRYRALAPCRVELDASRIHSRPKGLLEGGDGQSFKLYVNGSEVFPPPQSMQLAAGDVYEVRTPGGGGYGPVSKRSEADKARDKQELWL